MNPIFVPVILGEGARLPEYKTAGSAGADLYANIAEPIWIQPMERRAVPTGVRMELPEGYEAQVRPRSGLALDKGITCLNSPGTIDSDYRGEIKVILVNLGTSAARIDPGDRIAQLVIAGYTGATFLPKETIRGTDRGDAGFGSTGT
jgi:dUTP pyrophosphatase